MTDSGGERGASGAIPVSFRVNGEPRTVVVHPLKRLLDTLREDLGLTGTKEGCGEGECGACTVLLDGRPAVSCLVPTGQVAGREVATIESLAAGGRLHPMQAAFLECGGAQCGFCTPGMIMSAVYWMNDPDAAGDLREALAGNQCRCTGYTRIFQAVERCLKESGRPCPFRGTSLAGAFGVVEVGDR
jgi:carbon-monoxide dehydrogenase small subunit